MLSLPITPYAFFKLFGVDEGEVQEDVKPPTFLSECTNRALPEWGLETKYDMTTTNYSIDSCMIEDIDERILE